MALAPDVCEKCFGKGVAQETGTASGRRHFRCQECGNTWREKNPAAVALGRLGGLKAAENMTEEERQARSAKGGETTRRMIQAAKNGLK